MVSTAKRTKKKTAKKKKKKVVLTAEQKAALAAKRKAALAAQKIVVGVAKEKAKVNLAGWITVKEAAELLAVTPRRIRDFLLSGRLPAMIVGSTWLIQRKDVLDFSNVERKPGKPSSKKGKPQS
jgi:excisionase family DNA binding protein